MDEAYRARCHARRWSGAERRRLSAIHLHPEARRANAERHRAFWAHLDPARKAEITRKMVDAALKFRGRTSIERAVEEVLRIMEIPFVAQRRMGRFIADFYLPQWEIDLECDGDYWHGRADVRAKDARRDAELQRQGYLVVRIPEHAIKADAAETVRVALQSYLSS